MNIRSKPVGPSANDSVTPLTNRANQFFLDTFHSYKVVTSLSPESKEILCQKSDKLELKPAKKLIANSHVSGLRLGLALAGRTIFLLLGFYMGLKFSLEYFGGDVEEILVSTVLLFFVFFYVGLKTGEWPSSEATHDSAVAVFSIIDEKSTADVRKADVFSTVI